MSCLITTIPIFGFLSVLTENKFMRRTPSRGELCNILFFILVSRIRWKVIYWASFFLKIYMSQHMLF